MGVVSQEIQNQMKQIHDEVYQVQVQVLDGGKMPFKAHKTDAGFDLYASEDFSIAPGAIAKHPVNIRLKLPKGTYAEITSKSGLGSKGILVYAGIIDEEYRGVPHVLMHNLNPNMRWVDVEVRNAHNEVVYLKREPQEVALPMFFKKGEKIAQMIIHPYSPHYYLQQVDDISTDTARGEGGFGSTGNK